MKTPLNKQTLRQHLTYSWWKYALLIIGAIFVTDLLFTVTAYHAPDEKKIEFYIYGYADTEGLESYMYTVRDSQMQDMEEMTSVQLLADETYGPMQLTTYLAAGEGDLYLLPKEEFVSYANNGYFIPLEDDEELMAVFNEAGISLQSGWRRNNETGETHLYGIPYQVIEGLNKFVYVEDGYLCIFVNNGNTDNILKFFRIMSRELLTGDPAETAGAEAAPAETAAEPVAEPAAAEPAAEDAGPQAVMEGTNAEPVAESATAE